MVQIVRVYSGTDGESHFEDLTPDQLAEIVGNLGEGDIILNQRQYNEQDPNYHNAPRLQYVIHIAGVSEYEVADGTVRRLLPGDVLVAEDMTGHGHIARIVTEDYRCTLGIPLV
jgi:hypothetical protein